MGNLFNAVAKALGPTDEKPFLDLARELYEGMTNISEEVYAAGWLYDWEHPLWDHALNRPFEGMQTSIGINRDVSVAQINHVMELSMKCQGWIAWIEPHGPTWIPIDDWLWHLEDIEKHSLEGKGIALEPE